MNVVDLILIILVGVSAWSGWRKGFIWTSGDVLSWTGSLLLGFYTYQGLAAFFDRILSMGPWSFPVAFLLVVLIARILFFIISTPLYQYRPETIYTNHLNHTFGLVPGFTKGIIYAILFASLLLATPIMGGLTTKARNSRVAKLLVPEVEWLQERLSPLFDNNSRGMSTAVVNPEKDEYIKLKFTVQHARSRPDLEAKMLQLVNMEREKAGLQKLRIDPQLRDLARSHSVDMLERGYFAHVTPDGKDPFDRMRAAGIQYFSAGENLAFGATLSIAHRGLMESPGHRENILRPAFGRIGIGVLDGGRYGLMISQEFSN